MKLRPVQLARTLVYVKRMPARMCAFDEDKQLVALEKYETECATDTWLDRCATKIADRIAALENQLQGARPGDRFELLDALRTFRQALQALELELGDSRARVERLAVLRAQARGQSRLRLVQSE